MLIALFIALCSELQIHNNYNIFIIAELYVSEDAITAQKIKDSASSAIVEKISTIIKNTSRMIAMKAVDKTVKTTTIVGGAINIGFSVLFAAYNVYQIYKLNKEKLILEKRINTDTEHQICEVKELAVFEQMKKFEKIFVHFNT